MNRLQHLFGRRVGARCAPPAENAPGPKRKNATIHGLTPLWVAAALATGLWGNSQRAEAAISEGFETGMPTSYSTGNYVLGSGTWYFTKVIRGTTRHTGSYSCQIRSSTGALAITPTLSNGVGTITFWVYSSTASGALQVNLSTNGGTTWTAASGSPFTGLGSSWVAKTVTVNNASVDKVQFRRTAATIYLDDLAITDYAPSASAPTVTTVAASSIAATSATLGGNVTAAGGATVTNRGVVYKTSSGVTISDNKTPIGTGTGAFSNTVSSLSVNTRYYFRAYAQNSAGTSLGSESNFWTLANVPSAPTVANPTSSSLDITVNANGNPGTTQFAIQRTSDNQYLQSDGSWGASAVWATAATWGTKTATGLSPSTTYYFRVKARNGANTETAFSSTGSGTTSASGCSTYWHALYDRGAPLVTYYVGDYMGTNYEFAINQDTTGWTVEYGIGTSTDGTGWTWETATWSRMDGANNRVWKADSDEYQFTSAGTHYYAGRFTTGSCTYYADVDWEETSGGGLSAASYFTVSAINNPSGQDAAPASSSQINLSWSKNAQSHDVMVVRSADSSFTAPTPGQAYSVGNTIGGDTVIYNGSGTSYNDTGREANTTYYYKFYSVNNGYYSSGVTDSATTYGPPTVSTTSATPGTPADPTQANATGNVTADGGSTVTERGIVWQSTAGDPDTSDHKVAHASGGTGSFTVTLTGLTPGQTVYYRAYATNSTAVAYGSTLNFTADCFTNGPGILAASAVGSDTFTANWEAVAGATGY
jgi:hypothetical protein